MKEKKAGLTRTGEEEKKKEEGFRACVGFVDKQGSEKRNWIKISENWKEKTQGLL